VGEVTIQVRRNGPYKVTGPVTITDSEGRAFELPPGSSVVLCRCGHSKTKPFCDTTHREIGFTAVETAPLADG
jgi:CDGSH iron-sulfur domain-containing protein 3